MSELKTIYAEDTFDEDYMEYHHSDKRYYREVYLKSEADKVIAEKDKKIAELEEERRWRKFSEEKPPKYTWCLVSGKSQMGNYIVITDLFEEDDWAENPNLDDDTLDIEWWMPLPSAPEEQA